MKMTMMTTTCALLAMMALAVEFAEEFVARGAEPASSDTIEQKQLRENALQVLVALGYAQKEAERAVKKVEITDGMSSDTILKQALKHMF